MRQGAVTFGELTELALLITEIANFFLPNFVSQHIIILVDTIEMLDEQRPALQDFKIGVLWLNKITSDTLQHATYCSDLPFSVFISLKTYTTRIHFCLNLCPDESVVRKCCLNHV